MKEYRSTAVILLALSFLPALAGLSGAGEPERPLVDFLFDFEQEERINDLIHLHSAGAFERLKDLEFHLDEHLVHKAAFKAYNHRRQEGIALALNHLKSPVIRIVQGRMVSRVADFVLAKRILEVFPEQSVTRLVELYGRSDAVTRGNIIRASGNISGVPVKDLLVNALDDKTFSEEESPEGVGDPLRICDVAYNQLVLRYKVKNVLRTIGPIHKIEIRDYHIDILKGRL